MIIKLTLILYIEARGCQCQSSSATSNMWPGWRGLSKLRKKLLGCGGGVVRQFGGVSILALCLHKHHQHTTHSPSRLNVTAAPRGRADSRGVRERERETLSFAPTRTTTTTASPLNTHTHVYMPFQGKTTSGASTTKRLRGENSPPPPPAAAAAALGEAENRLSLTVVEPRAFC